MSGDDIVNTPSVLWAQRSSTVLLTICLEDCLKPNIDLKERTLNFSGIGGPEKKSYKLNFEFFKEIDPEKSIVAPRDRVIELVLKKKDENGEFWPRLTNDKVKHHWLKVDFNKWKDEDDSEEEVGEGMGGNMDLESMMTNLGRMDNSGAGGKDTMDDLRNDEDEDYDSDDGDLPGLI